MLSRRQLTRISNGAGLSRESSRFVPKLNETCMRGRSPLLGRRRRARLTALRHSLLAQLALDRERGEAPQRDQRQPYIGKAPASPA